MRSGKGEQDLGVHDGSLVSELFQDIGLKDHTWHGFWRLLKISVPAGTAEDPFAGSGSATATGLGGLGTGAPEQLGQLRPSRGLLPPMRTHGQPGCKPKNSGALKKRGGLIWHPHKGPPIYRQSQIALR